MLLHLSVSHSVYRGGMSRPRPRGEVGGSGRGVSRPRPRGEVRWSGWGGCLGPGPGGRLGGLVGGCLGPDPGGRLGGLAGGGVQAHTWRGGCPGPYLWGCPGPGGVQAQGMSRPTPRRVSRPTSGGWGFEGHPGLGCPGGGCVPACTKADTPQQTATVAGRTHPTGMLSCYN